jgi:hypothetical protein
MSEELRKYLEDIQGRKIKIPDKFVLLIEKIQTHNLNHTYVRATLDVSHASPAYYAGM